MKVFDVKQIPVSWCMIPSPGSTFKKFEVNAVGVRSLD